MRLYYAQNREDLLIKSFFPDVKNGFYIDVGANDPVRDSVTKIFYDEGWSGINVEPIQKHFDALKQQRPRDINILAGLSNKKGKQTFRHYSRGDGLSTFDTAMTNYYDIGEHHFPTKKFREYEVVVKTLQEVIDDNTPQHVHFIKIDVEGYEYEVIDGYDWKKNRPELVCIEANHINKDWRPLLESKKYIQVFFDGVNNYYLAEESLKRKEHFSYPNAVFAGNPVYHQAFLEIATEERKNAANQLRIISDKEREISILQKQQRDVRFLVKRLVSEIQARVNRRAKGNIKTATLVYKTDNQISRKLDSDREDKQELLKFIHSRDQANVVKQNRAFSDTVTRLLWRTIAWSLKLGVKATKKMRSL